MSDFLRDVLRGSSAPSTFREVKVRCQNCGATRTIPANTYREVVANLGLGFICDCGTFVSMVRQGDDVTFPYTPLAAASVTSAHPPKEISSMPSISNRSSQLF